MCIHVSKVILVVRVLGLAASGEEVRVDQTYNVCLLSKARTAGRRSTCLGRQTQLRNPDGTGKPRTKTQMLGREPQHRIQWGHARSTRPRMRQRGRVTATETAKPETGRGEEGSLRKGKGRAGEND